MLAFVSWWALVRRLARVLDPAPPPRRWGAAAYLPFGMVTAMLQALGLTAAEEALYHVLLGRPHMSVGELRDSGAVGNGPPEPVLSSLEEKGLVSRVSGSPRRYAASPPEHALEMLILAREEDLRAARKVADQLTQRFLQSRRQNDPADLIEVVSGAQAVSNRRIQMLHSARRELRGVDKTPWSERVGETERELIGGGVTSRRIYDRSVFDQPDLAGLLLDAVASGEQARVMSGVPVKLLVVDDRQALVSLEEEGDAIESALVVHPSSLLDALARLFDGLWQRAVPITRPGSRIDSHSGPEPPSEHDAVLLTLLATGLTDEAIARQLDVSQRTVQRYIRGLMDRLGADTRFQAGLQAARRGWL